MNLRAILCASLLACSPLTLAQVEHNASLANAQFVLQEQVLEPSLHALQQYGPVAENDTLWQIATRYRNQYLVNNTSLFSVSAAIYIANKAAFLNGDINQLKSGSLLQMPSMALIESISAKEGEAIIDGKMTELTTSHSPVNYAQINDAQIETATLETVTQVTPLEVDLLAVQQELGLLQSDLALLMTQNTAIIQENQQLTERITSLENQLLQAKQDYHDLNSQLVAAQQQLIRQQTKPAVNETFSWQNPKLLGFAAVLLLIGWSLGFVSPRPAQTQQNTAETPSGILDSLDEQLDKPLKQAMQAPLESPPEVSQAKPVEKDKGFIAIDDLIAEAKLAEPSEPTLNIAQNLASMQHEKSVVKSDSEDQLSHLDLAKIYLELGRDDEARTLLNTVLEQGHGEEQASAKAMLMSRGWHE